MAHDLTENEAITAKRLYDQLIQEYGDEDESIANVIEELKELFKEDD